MASRKLNILSESLIKKEKILNEKLQNNFDTVAQANGQPLNDKRNGHKTLAKWESQNDSIRRQMESIERTKLAIEKEEWKIANVNSFEIPNFLLPFIESGDLVQWRKFPNRFFVNGVNKGRLIWDSKKSKLMCSHLSEIPKDQVPRFKEIASLVIKKYNEEKEHAQQDS